MRPAKDDYAPYYETYISKVTIHDPVKAIEAQYIETMEFIKLLDEDKAAMPYSEGKWTYKQTLGHMIDTERIMAYRALCIARGENKPLPGFDQDPYVVNGNFNSRTLEDLASEYRAIIESNILLFRSFDEEALKRRGVANNNVVTVLALGFIIAGHNKHHLGVLKNYFGR